MGSLNTWDPFWGVKQCQYKVYLRDFTLVYCLGWCHIFMSPVKPPSRLGALDTARRAPTIVRNGVK